MKTKLTQSGLAQKLAREQTVELHFTTGMDLVCYQGCPVN